MMESVKQLFMKKSSLIIYFLLILLSNCKNYQPNNELVLECVLSIYIESLKEKLEDHSVVLIEDIQGWTDSTSIVIFQLIDAKYIEGFEDYSVTKYNEVTIYMIQRHILNGAGSFVKKNGMTNNLNWTYIANKLNSKLSDPDCIPPLEQFWEVQLVYHPQKDCLEEIILFPLKVDSSSILNCNNCN
jgi:hypothetical protein